MRREQLNILGLKVRPCIFIANGMADYPVEEFEAFDALGHPNPVVALVDHHHVLRAFSGRCHAMLLSVAHREQR